MSSLNNKIDFALVFAVTNANPNGDPLDGNRPRTDFRGFGEVSDVCLKRKIRNRLSDMGRSIFVQSDDRRTDEYRSLKDRASGCPDLAALLKKKEYTRSEYADIACKTWYDVRAFGQVFAFKDKKDSQDENSDSVSIGIRGPVSIQAAISCDPVTVTSTQITKSVNLETGKDPDKKGSDTIGTKHRVDFGVYTTFGSINVQQANKTGFSSEDAGDLKEALRTLFVNDETAARPSGSMEVLKLVWWEHNCPTGQYSPAKVHRLLKVTRKPAVDIPVTIDDYDIVIDELPELSYHVYDGE